MEWHNNMKQIIIISTAFLFVLTSCGSTKKTVFSPVISDIIKGQVENIIYSNKTEDSTVCLIDYSYFSSIDLPYKDSINQTIKRFTSNITQFERGLGGNSILSNSFFKAQLDSFELICISEEDEEYSHLWELECSIEIDDSRDSLVQLQITAWSYTGGAHGNGSTVTFIYDKSSARKLMLEDIFSDVIAVTAIGEMYFRSLYQLDPDTDLDDAGFWFENNKFHLNNNFSIMGDSFEFLYNSYEIAPYSGGETIIEIPIEEIKNYIKIKI